MKTPLAFRSNVLVLLKVLLYFSVGVVTALLLLQIISPKTGFQISWIPYVRTEEATFGYLYELANEDEGIGIYIATDRVPDPKFFSKHEDWTLRELSYEEIWNPRICAKMPTVIDPKGDVFMLDAQRIDRNALIYKFIHFSKQANTVLQTDISSLKWSSSFLFLDSESNPYFFKQDGNEVSTYTHTQKSEFFKKNVVAKLSPDEKILLARTSFREPIVGVFNTKTLLNRNYKYDGKELREYSGRIPISIARLDEENKSITDLGNDIVVTYLLDTPYEFELTKNSETILKFFRGGETYAYVIGTYQK